MTDHLVEPTIHAPHAGRLRRPRYAARGQALIMAVLVMFVLAGLGGVFIALIHSTMVQMAQADERSQLDQVLQAGLRLAQNELVYSADGADWRPDAGPDPANPGWIHFGKGFYHITVTYGPTPDAGATTDPVLGQDNPLERFLRIDVLARFALDNPPDDQLRTTDPDKYAEYLSGYASARRYLARSTTAYIPIGLTDYLLWITNLQGGADPARLGTDLQLTDPKDPALGILTVNLNTNDSTISDSALSQASAQVRLPILPYLPIYEGPILCNTDLEIGDVRIDLTNGAAVGPVFRRDLLQTAGYLSEYAGSSALNRRLMVNAANLAMNVAPTVNTQRVLDPVASRASAVCIPYLQTRENNPLVKTMRAPRLDLQHRNTGLDRFRMLTRDSLAWGSALSATLPDDAITLRRGEGLYINNAQQIQYNHDLDRLRAEWMDCSATHWTNGVYSPQTLDLDTSKSSQQESAARAIEVQLNDWYTNASGIAQPPTITLRRSDGREFYDEQFQSLGSTVNLPYPRNGVVFAEGNIVVKGSLPASLAYDSTTHAPFYDADFLPAVQRPGGWNDADNTVRYYVNAWNRRFDLTVVSNGTIYIEGNVLSPATERKTYIANGAETRITSGSPYDSKLGLLAMDHVCLNPTNRLINVEPGAANLTQNAMGEQYYSLFNASQASPLGITFSTAGPINPRTRLLLRHAGDGQLDNYTIANMALWSGSSAVRYPYIWNPPNPQGGYGYNPTTNLYFGDPAIFPALSPTQWGGNMYQSNGFTAQAWPLIGSDRFPALPDFTPLQGYGAKNVIELSWAQGGPYLVAADASGVSLTDGPVVTGIDLQIDALIYAQRGSWFIIPGLYPNTDPNLTLPFPYPQYMEPLDLHITVNGAIAENRPAPPDDEDTWLARWRGANWNYFSTSAGNTVPDLWDPGNAWDVASRTWVGRRMGIEYRYDATLAMPVCYELDERNQRSYRPRLPKLPVSPNVFSFERVSNVIPGT